VSASAYWWKEIKKSDLSVSEILSVKGTVISNHKGCASDGNCVMVIRLENGKNISIIYGSGLTQTGSCSVSGGLEIEPGDEIEASGELLKEGFLTLCRPGSTIKKNEYNRYHNLENLYEY
jgi:hypothetical protein